MPAKKMGRPPASDPRNYNFHVRLTDSEVQLLTELSKKLGLTKSETLVAGLKKLDETTP